MGVLSPIPIPLPIDPEQLPAHADRIVLCDARNNNIAVMQIEEAFSWDPNLEASLVLGTNDSQHPLASEMTQWGTGYLSGGIKVLSLPKNHEFRELRLTPAQVR